MAKLVMLVEYDLPDDADLDDAIRPLLDAVRSLSPGAPSNVTAFLKESAEAVLAATQGRM